MHLRRLFRTIFLIDYFTNAAFRHEMQHVLNRDEAVHILQRASDPDIKGVVQEQVGQQRAHYAAYNVAYFSLRRLNHSNFRCQKPQAVGQP